MQQKYKLAIVSGGKVSISRAENRSSTHKIVVSLTHDEDNFIVPFNNQLKIYSIETRQCVKTLKFSNNSVLNEIFCTDDRVSVMHIALGDVSMEDDSQTKDKITLFSSNNHVIVINYKGKLVDEPKHWKLEFPNPEESVFKVFTDDNGRTTKLCTVFENSSSTYTYNIYSYSSGEVEHIKSYEGVLLSTWSKNDRYIGFLIKGENGKKQVILESLQDKNFTKTFPLPLVNASSSKNAHFVTSMALDGTGEQLALGFASGVISLVNTGDFSTRLLKWHIDSVLSMSFNVDGSYLLSGGWEKVVSFWQLSTNRQQFLPRLNGTIIDCSVVHEKYFSLALQMTQNVTNADYQVLLMKFTDLHSRLAINGPLPVFKSAVKDAIQPISAMNTKASISGSKLHQSKKKRDRKLKRKKQDYTVFFAIHPVTKHLYFPHKSALQAMDFYKNEQVSYQYLSLGINNAMGKVRGELNLKDPEIQQVHFTSDGKWMVTYEVEYPPEGLLSSNDNSHILKFWILDDTNEWQLKTKVLNPHSVNVPITSITMAPVSINASYGCITADNNGGLKYWSFNSKEKNWCLTKMALPNFSHYSNNVSVVWSRDGSLIFHAFDDKLSIIDFTTFGKFEPEDSKRLETIALDSAVQCVKLVNDTMLVIVTKTVLNFLNLLSGQLVSSFDLYPYINGMYKPGCLSRLISCDEKNGTLALVINKQKTDQEDNATASYESKVLVFNANVPRLIATFSHNEYISCIAWNHNTDFIFIDIQCKLGLVSTTTSFEMLDELNNEGAFDGLLVGKSDFEEQLRNLSKQNERNLPTDDNEEAEIEFINSQTTNKVINMNSFTSMFENIDNIQLDTLFDRVMRVLS
ncbi:HHL044Wp [Eremothecium sinecaudum]|uniref:HHL044Wp n=1 Tax=Eremothecium sinecaudum TaxID=45286 RepID=A0A109V0G0_9SACH|nr:HHL044Wp [Eremothecium sinecaudum]AMD22726.1 HHL044Wp [Eremothecium sinecaudum]